MLVKLTPRLVVDGGHREDRRRPFASHRDRLDNANLQSIYKPFSKVPIIMDLDKLALAWRYIVFHRQGKLGYGGLVLGLHSSQFLLLPKLPQKITLNSKVVKIDSKIIILLCQFKSVAHFAHCTHIQSVPWIYIKEARWLFLSQFWPLLNRASFLVAAGAVV